MGRTRSFDEATVVEAAAVQFRVHGYEATSLDDLLRVTGLHRGSLYQAFGSKRGVFLACLARADVRDLDLLLVALLELAPIDTQIHRLCTDILPTVGPVEKLAAHLGARLIERAGIDLHCIAGTFDKEN